MALRYRQPCFSLPTSQPSSHPGYNPAPHFSSLGWHLLPQKHPSWAGLQLPTVLPCLAVGPPTHLSPSLALAHSSSQGGAWCLVPSLSLVPLAARSWLALWDRPWLPDPDGVMGSSCCYWCPGPQGATCSCCCLTPISFFP